VAPSAQYSRAARALPLAGAGRPGRAHPGAPPRQQAPPRHRLHPHDPRRRLGRGAQSQQGDHQHLPHLPAAHPLEPPHCGERYAWDCSPGRASTLGASNPGRRRPRAPEARARHPRGPRPRGHRQRRHHPHRQVQAASPPTPSRSTPACATSTARPSPSRFAPPSRSAARPVAALDGVVRDPIVLEPSHRGVLDLKASGLTEVEVRARSMARTSCAEVLSERTTTTATTGKPFLRRRQRGAFDVSASRARGDDACRRPPAIWRACPASLLLLGARSNRIGDDGYNYRQSLQQHRRGHAPGHQRRDRQRQRRRPRHRPRDRRAAPGRRLELHSSRHRRPAVDRHAATPAAWPSSRTAASARPAVPASPRRPGRPRLRPAAGDRRRQLVVVAVRATPRTSRARSSSPTASPTSPARRSTSRASSARRPAAPRAASVPWRSEVECDLRGHRPARPRAAHRQGPASARSGPSASTSRCPPTATSAYQFLRSRTRAASSAASAASGTLRGRDLSRARVRGQGRARGRGPAVYGDTLAAEVRAAYLHGAPMVGAKVNYTLRRSDTAFRPPGSEHEPFSFGPTPQPWWWRGNFGEWAAAGTATAAARRARQAGRRRHRHQRQFAVTHLLQAKESAVGRQARRPRSRRAGAEGPAGSAVRQHLHARGPGHRPEPPGDRRPPELRRPPRRRVRRPAQRSQRLQGGRARPRRGRRRRRRRQARRRPPDQGRAGPQRDPPHRRRGARASGRTSTRPSTSRPATAS
jgi:hypothetical protein